ncbi:hypothetical protein [Colwellia piezophila]|uniref:hypothetical protein n=1 Tax=Colwellia piezophila TaxID=211668 RepID=UPI000368A607|nr:hypothetical protein [Colwellia piezophila]
MQNGLIQFLIKFLLLLCASLSVHSALALPLSSVLASNYHAATDSVDLAEQFNTSTVLNDLAYQPSVQSKLQKSLLTLLQQEHNYRLNTALFLAAMFAADIDIAQVNVQTLIRLAYQEQLITHTYIQGRQNALYTQKSCYQAKLQYQQNLS